MATFAFHTFGLGQVGIVGADPFAGATNTSPAAVGTVITLDADASRTLVTVIDDEAHLHDDDLAPAQSLAAPVVIDGTVYAAGTHVETEYEYIVRPASSSNPADNFSIHAITMNGVIVGIAATGPLVDGASYRIVAAGSSAPTVHYVDLVVCFAAGTRILTPWGERRVETLRPGDRVTTADDGVQPVAWVGRQIARGTGPRAPVCIPQGTLGAARDLYLSPQHRLLLPGSGGRETLLPATALVGAAGLHRAPRFRVVYHHILFDRHQIVFAEGVRAESLFPGKLALRAMGVEKRAEIRRALPGARFGTWHPARPLGRPGQARRELRPGPGRDG